MYHESDLERHVSYYLQARHDVDLVYSQYPRVTYPDADGKWREHVFDYFAVLTSGVRLAVAVKYEKEREETDALLERIQASGVIGVGERGKRTPGVADEVRLLTDLDVTVEMFENAQAILGSRGHHDDAQCRALLEIVQMLPGAFRMGQLLLGCEDRALRRTAILRLIDEGHLRVCSRGRIDELTWLRFRGQ